MGGGDDGGSKVGGLAGGDARGVAARAVVRLAAASAGRGGTTMRAALAAGFVETTGVAIGLIHFDDVTQTPDRLCGTDREVMEDLGIEGAFGRTNSPKGEAATHLLLANHIGIGGSALTARLRIA